MRKVCCVQAKTLKFSPHVQLHKVTYGPKYRPHTPLATGTKNPQKKNRNSFFLQNGSENYFRFRFSAIFVFFTLDLVDLAKNRKNYSGALFRDIWVKVEKFKNILNELQEFPTCNFLTFFGRCTRLPLRQNSFTFIEK